MVELVLTVSLLAVMGLALMMTLNGSRVTRWPIGGAVALPVSWSASALSATLTGHPGHLPLLFAGTFLPVLLLGRILRRLRWPARLFFSTFVLASSLYAVALVWVTFGGSLPPLSLGMSLVLLALELFGIVLSVIFAFEMVEALGHDPLVPATPLGSANHQPLVCLQVPAYNEPPELIRTTLEALARLDYQNYMVQVVVNNTTDPALWQPVQAACAELGPRFEFIHLPKWPGFKAGALNEATRRLPRQVEVVGIIDADYVVEPNFLSACLPYFADPTVAFVQTPQHYRDWQDSAYLRGLFHAYRYFFDVNMVARARVNAIIFGGTMGLIRRSALHEIGGWAEWCITEDAEASLRILARGWTSVYVNQPFGKGLMPLDFDGLRRQRFRWAFGGIQIIRRHFAMLLGLTPSRLTLGQRYHYLAGGLSWFGEPLVAALTFFLLVTAGLMATGHPILLRQLIGLLIVMPTVMLVAGLTRLGWALKVATGCRWKDVPVAMMVMLALSWTVTQACVAGLVRQRGVFFRTPKVRSPSHLRTAVLSTSLESAVSSACLVLAPVVLLLGPRPLGPVMAVMLAWQAIAWGSAPTASLMSQGVALTPLRRLFGQSPQNTGMRALQLSAAPRRFIVAPAIALAAFFLLPALLTAPDDIPVPGLNLGPRVVPAQANNARPSPPPAQPASGRPPVQGAAATPGTSPSPNPSPTPFVTPGPSPRPTPSGSPSPLPSPTTHGRPSATPSPSPTPHHS
jgi:glycosyltransferase involved in cell wall biosynthesis